MNNKNEKSVKWFSRALRFGRRAIGALYNEFARGSFAEVKNEFGETITGTIGPIEIVEDGGVRYGRNTADFSVVLSFSSSNNNGSSQQSKEMFFKPASKAEKIELGDEISQNLTGVASWRQFDNEGKYSIANDGHRSGGLITSINNWSQGSLNLSNKDLGLSLDTNHNRFIVMAHSCTYDDVTIDVITLDGSFYNFGPFKVQKGGTQIIDYPDEMDNILPIPLITFRANCDEQRYNDLLYRS